MSTVDSTGFLCARRPGSPWWPARWRRAPRSGERVEAGELGGQRPEPGRLVGVNGVVLDTDSGAVGRSRLGDVAVLEVDAAHAGELRGGRCPDLGGGTLLDGLRFADHVAVLV